MSTRMSDCPIGFGKIEIDAEERFCQDLLEHVSAIFRKETAGYFTSDLVSQVSEWVKNKAAQSQEAADRLDKCANPPERYFRLWPYTLGDANYIVVILTFHHLNRRHPFSSDGWASWQNKRLFHIYLADLQEAQVQEESTAREKATVAT